MVLVGQREGIGDRGSQPWLAPALGQAAGASYQRSNRYRHGAGDTACQCGSAGRPNSADVPLNIVCVHCADQSFRVRLWSFSKSAPGFGDLEIAFYAVTCLNR